jgi:hypothetical protein
MSPELMFWFALAAKMAITALFVSAVASLALNTATAIFVVVYVLVAQRHSLWSSVFLAFTAWVAATLALGPVQWTAASAVALSFQIGPAGRGMLAVFPVIYMSIMVILHPRVGGPATAAMRSSMCGPIWVRITRLGVGEHLAITDKPQSQRRGALACSTRKVFTQIPFIVFVSPTPISRISVENLCWTVDEPGKNSSIASISRR